VAPADDDNTGGEVLETNRGIGYVFMLPPRTAGPEGSDAALFFEIVEYHDYPERRTQDTERRKEHRLIRSL
jgi:hypothetical protein